MPFCIVEFFILLLLLLWLLLFYCAFSYNILVINREYKNNNSWRQLFMFRSYRFVWKLILLGLLYHLSKLYFYHISTGFVYSKRSPSTEFSTRNFYRISYWEFSKNFSQYKNCSVKITSVIHSSDFLRQHKL